MSHSGMVQSAGSSGGPANNQGGRNSQPPTKYQSLPQGHQAQHVPPPSNHSVAQQHRANPQPQAPPQLRAPGPGVYQYSRPLAQPDMKSGPGHVVNQGSHPHQAMNHYAPLPMVAPMQMQHSAPMIAPRGGYVMVRGQPGGYSTGRLTSPPVTMAPNQSYTVRPQTMGYPLANTQAFPSNFYTLPPNAQMGQNLTQPPIMNQSQPTQNPPPKRKSMAIAIVNPTTGEQVTAGPPPGKISSGPPASATLMVHPSTMGAMSMPVAGAPIVGPPPTNAVFVPGSPGMPLPMPVMDQEQQPKVSVPKPESVAVDVQTKRENSSSSHSPAPQIGANVAPPAAVLTAPTPVVPPAPEAPIEPVKDVPPVASAPVTSAKVDSNSTKPVPSAADEDEERRKVEERNEENLRKSQEATKHDSSPSVPVQDNSTAPAAAVAEVAVVATLAAPTQDEPKQAVESVKPPAEEQQEEVTEPPKATAPQSPPASSITAAGEVKGVEPTAPSSPKAASDTTLEEGEVVSDEGETDPVLSATGHMYKPGQWSPVCPDGKKQYDRDFLLKLQNRPLSMNPPSEMPILDIFKEHRHTLPSISGMSHASASLDGYTQRNGQRPNVGAMHRNKPQMRNSSDRTKKIITLSSSMNEDVKLHVAENAWKPVKEQNADSDAALYKKFRGILNKLTPQKFTALLDQVKQLEINTEERLSNVTNLVLEKALNETHFASTYAKLCHTLLTEFQIVKRENESATAQTVNFRKMLLQKCQHEFERDTDDSAESRKREKEQEETRSKQLRECETEQQRKELLESFEEQDLKAKRRTLGLMRFIGELYNLSILNFNIMHDCFLKLLKNPTDEDSIVCACKLFTTVGKKLNEDIKHCAKEQDKAIMKEKYDQLMVKLRKIISENREAQKNNGVHLPTRVIFMLEDVWELKTRSWVPRRDEQAPKTLDQIVKEAENEKILASHPPGSSGGGSSGGNARYNSMPNDRNRARNYGSQTQGQGSMYKTAKEMIGQIKLPTISAPFGATRGGQNWVAGASGGGSRNSSLRGSSRLDNNDSSPNMSNRYELLTTDASDHPVRSQESSPSRAHDREQVRGREAAIQGARTLSHYGNNRAQSGPRGSAPTSRTPSLSGPTAPGTTYSLLGKNEDNEDQVKRYAETIFAEYLVNANKADFLHDFCERVHKDNLEQFIAHFMNLAIEKPKNLGPLAEAIRELHNARILSVRNFESILKEQLEYAEDMVIDIPKYYEYMADLVSQLVNEMDSISLIRVICDTLKENSPKLLLPLFKRIKEAGGNGVAAKWKKSGLSIAELVSGASDNEMKLLEEALTDLGAPSSASAVPDMTVAELTKRFRAAFDIKDAEERDKKLQDIIQKAGKDHRITALRACATAILNFGLKETKHVGMKETKYFDQKFVEDRLTPMPAPIKELFAEDICIHALYALQIVSNELHHPKDITSHYLNFVYDHDLVDDTTILKWGDNTSMKHEAIGYQMTTAHAQSFLAWLQECPGTEAEPNN